MRLYSCQDHPAMDVSPVGTSKSGLSAHLREAKKKENQPEFWTNLLSGSVSVSWSNKLLLVKFL